MLEIVRTEQKDTRSHFNHAAKGRTHGTYEADRWAADARVKAQYQAAERFIQKRVLPLASRATSIAELGPGPGTWTRLLHTARPQARFLLLDISSEMLARARAVLPADTVVETREADFGEVPVKKGESDFFFSSRALEYVTDKSRAVAKIQLLLAAHAHGCVITKMPKTLANKLSGRTPTALHQGQIDPRSLKKLFVDAGFSDLKIYPVTFAVPFFRSAMLDTVAGAFLGKLPLNPFSEMLAESYAITFRAP